MLGVPYPNWTPAEIAARVDTQAKTIAADLKTAGGYISSDKEIIALIAYLQQLGHAPVIPMAKPVAVK